MEIRDRYTIAVALCLIAVSVSGSESKPGIELDAGLFGADDAPCLVVENLGADTVAEYFDDGDVILRAGSWLGREGLYLLPPPESADVAIRVRVLGRPNISPDDFRVSECPQSMPAGALQAWSAAIDLRLRAYLGEAVALQSVESRLIDAIRQLDGPGLEHLRAVANYEAGSFFRHADQLQRAEQFYQAAHDGFVAASDPARAAAATNALGLVAWRRGLLDEAERLFDRALQARVAKQDTYQVGSIANNLGLLTQQRGNFGDAVMYYETALSIFQGEVDLRKPVSTALAGELASRLSGPADLGAALNTLNNLALLQRDRGRLDVAELYWRNFLALETYVSDAMAGARARRNLAQLLQRQGRLDEALLMLIDTLRQFETGGTPRWIAETRVQLSRLYFHLGDQQTAGRYAELAATMDLEDVNASAGAWRHLGALQRFNEDYATAIESLELAASLMRQAEDARQWLRTRSEIAFIRFLQGDHETALSDQRELHQSLLDAGDDSGAARVLSRIGEILFREGRPEAARRALEDALEAHRAAHDVFAEIDTLERLGRLYEDRLGQDDASARLIELNTRAIELAETVRAGQLAPLHRAGVSAVTRSVYLRHINALLAAGQTGPAWAVAERARARAIVELRQTRTRTRAQPQRRSLLDQRAHAVQRLHQQVMRPDVAPAEQGSTLAIRREIDRIEAELEALSPSGGASEPPPDLARFQRNLGPDQLVLSYFIHGDGGIMWIIASDRARAERLPADVEAKTGELLGQLRNPRHALGRIELLARELGEALLQPAASEIASARELIIQPDGALHSLPFALLLADIGTQAARDAPGHAVAHILSATAPPADFAAATDSLLVMADPGWSGDSINHTVFPEQSLLGRLMRDQSPARLPGTRREAEAIAELAGESGQVWIRLGANATREFVLAGGLRGHRRVHIATHGLVDLQYPMLSSLLLAGEGASGPAFLRPHEIAELELDAELVVLSGCETGYGTLLAGEGALSLARPFLVAGAGQVLASLWKIDDHRTTQFMERFYRHLLTENQPAPRALALAQHWMRNQPATSHPYYWAGFVLTSASLSLNE